MGQWYSEPSAGAVVEASNGIDVYYTYKFAGRRHGEWECECSLHRERGKECKHISLARKAIRLGRKIEGVISFFDYEKAFK